jgi:N-methylhydantoinase A
VLKALDLDQLRAALDALEREQVESVAICFINSYLNPEHEKRAAALARERLGGVPVCASHEVLPAFREYERTSTTCVNAYLMPVVARYLDSLERELSRYAKTLRIMQSNGGVMSAAHARARPIYMVESGPAAGVLAAAALTRELGLERAVSFDMGGTTVKACLIESSDPVEKGESEVGGEANAGARFYRGKGYALSVPSLDIVEAGAGGGSIAWVDATGSLRVGPKSAGAVPGPVCYRGGGEQPTITDANVVLGYLNPVAIAGGGVAIDRPAAAAALERTLCEPLGLPLLEVAYGIHQVANAAMMRTVRAVTTERGRDAREYTLIAFGGSGPIHAAALARDLGIARVYLPLYPGLFSALGLLLADLRYDYVQSLPVRLADADPQALQDGFAALEQRARDDAAREGIGAEMLRLARFVDVRYERQVTEIKLEVPPRTPAAGLPAALAALFHAEHERLYSYRCPDEPVALVNLRAKAVAPAASATFAQMGEAFLRAAAAEHCAETSRRAYFGPQLGELETRILRRIDLAEGAANGPLIVEEFDTTIVVPPGWRASLDRLGSVVLEHVPQ